MGTTVAKLQAIVECNTDTATANLTKFSNKLPQTGNAVTKLNSALGAIGLGVSFAALTYGAISLGKQIVSLGMDMEQTRITFKTFLGSAEAADAMLGKLRQFAMETPFQFNDLTEASKRMMALGFQTEQVIPTLRTLGDTAAALGGGSELIQRMTLSLGQMQMKGRVSGEEMRELAIAGVPAWEYLATAIGKTTGETIKLSEKGLIPADVAMKAILGGMNRDFGGMMANQMDTAAGRASNLIDKLEQIGTTIGTDTLPATNALIDGLASAANAFDILYSWDRRVNDALKEQEKRVVATAGSYTEYVQAQGKALEATGALGQANIDEIVSMVELGKETNATGWTVDALAESFGLMTQAQWEQASANDIAAKSTQLLADRWQGLGNQFAQNQNVITDQAVVTNQLAANWEGLGKAYLKSAGYAETLKASQLKVSQALDILKQNMAGAIGSENESFYKSQEKLRKEAGDLTDEYLKLAATQGLAYGPAADLADIQLQLNNAQFDAESASLKLAEAQKELSANTDPAKQRELQGAVIDAQLAVSNMSGKVGEYSQAVQTASGGIVDHTTKLNDVKGKLAEINTALAENEAAHLKKTKQAILDMLEEAMARDNLKNGVQSLTDEQVLGLQKLATQWGLVDKATADANTAIITAVGDASKSGNWSALWGGQDTTKGKMDDILNAATNTSTAITTSVSTWATLPDWSTLQTQQASTSTAMDTIQTATITAGEAMTNYTSQSGNPVPWQPMWNNQTTTWDKLDKVAAAAYYIPRHIDIWIEVHQKGSLPDVGTPPGRAEGGPVSAGMPYLVGERGIPEIFVPGQDGTIVPTGGGRNVVNNYSLTVNTHNAPNVAAEFGRMRALAGA